MPTFRDLFCSLLSNRSQMFHIPILKNTLEHFLNKFCLKIPIFWKFFSRLKDNKGGLHEDKDLLRKSSWAFVCLRHTFLTFNKRISILFKQRFLITLILSIIHFNNNRNSHAILNCGICLSWPSLIYEWGVHGCKKKESSI